MLNDKVRKQSSLEASSGTDDNRNAVIFMPTIIQKKLTSVNQATWKAA